MNSQGLGSSIHISFICNQKKYICLLLKSFKVNTLVYVCLRNVHSQIKSVSDPNHMLDFSAIFSNVSNVQPIYCIIVLFHIKTMTFTTSLCTESYLLSYFSCLSSHFELKTKNNIERKSCKLHSAWITLC